MAQGYPFFILPLTFTIDAGTLLLYKIVNGCRGIGKKQIDHSSLEVMVNSEQKKDVTILISAHGSANNIESLVRAVFEQTYPIKNVYICDSNIDSTKKVIERLRNEFQNLRYWSRDGVTGKAEKINHLVRDQDVELGEFVYLKDASTVLAPGVIEKLVAGFSDDKIAAVTSFGYVTPPDNYLAKLFHSGKEWTNRLGKFRKTAQQYRRAMFVVCGASFMVRSDILKKIEIPVGTKTEDTAYTWKLQEEGYKVGVVQDAVVHAPDVATLDAQLKQSFRWYTGTWQNIFLNARKLFDPRSKARMLGYFTILPGLIESTLYTGTIVALPLIAQYNPDIPLYFIAGDTALSLASPFICTALDGNPREGPREFLKTIRHYHQITTYKLMSSLLWLSSGAKVIYDLITGRSKEWSNQWEILPETCTTVHSQRLTREYYVSNVNQFERLEKEWINLGEVGWTKDNFLLDKPKKWELSSYASIDDKIVGYTIVSEPEEKLGFLHKIVVDSDYQGKGIGSKLVEDAIRKCRIEGIGRMIFKVLTDNEPAIALYKKFGFTFSGPEMCPDNKERYNCELKL